MIFPLRCFTCGKLIGNKVASYEEQIKPIIGKAKVNNTKPTCVELDFIRCMGK